MSAWGSIASAGAKFGLQAFSGSQQKQVAKKNRQFQERMSNTAFQRRKADMVKAGINPLYGFEGASSPSGSVAGVPDYGSAVDTGVKAYDSGTKKKGVDQQGQIVTAMVDTQTATAAKIRKETELLDKGMLEADVMRRGFELLGPGLDKFQAWLEKGGQGPTPQTRGGQSGKTTSEITALLKFLKDSPENLSKFIDEWNKRNGRTLLD